MARREPSISLIATTIIVAAVLCAQGATAAMRDDSPMHQQHQAQEVHVELETDRSQMRASDMLRVTLRVTFPSTYLVRLPTAPEAKASGAKLGDFTVASLLDEAPVASGTPEQPRTTLTRRLMLEPFLPGDYSLPSLEIAWRTIDGSSSGVVRTTPVSIVVNSLLGALPEGQNLNPSQLDLGELRPAAELPTQVPNRLIGIALAVLLTVGLAAAALLRRKPVATDPLRHIEAMLASWPHDGADAPHQTLADALVLAGRTALADRLDPLAAACAGPELHRMTPLAQADPLLLRLLEIMERLDQARFSGAMLGPDDRRQYLADVLGAIRLLRTRPRVPGRAAT